MCITLLKLITFMTYIYTFILTLNLIISRENVDSKQAKNHVFHMLFKLVPGGGGTHILGHGREVPRWWPPFFRFSIRLGLFYTSTQSDWPPFSSEKNGLSLSHLVPEILGPKVGIIFHQNVLFNRF